MLIKIFNIIINFIIIELLISSTVYAEVNFTKNLIETAISLTNKNINYDGKYYIINYPLGDVPSNIGVCTDVIIRSYRSLGIDLQQKVHEDITENFHLYPNNWKLDKPDTNIDHRRVPNLQVFFTRHGKSLEITNDPKNFQPGDIVAWDIANWWNKILKNRKTITHIGIVTDQYTSFGVPLIVHHRNYGLTMEDVLFNYKIIGHYRYKP